MYCWDYFSLFSHFLQNHPHKRMMKESRKTLFYFALLSVILLVKTIVVFCSFPQELAGREPCFPFEQTGEMVGDIESE